MLCGIVLSCKWRASLWRLLSVASPAQKKWGVRTMFLCWWAVKVTIYIHGVHSLYVKKTSQRICANPKRGLNRSGGSGPTHSLRGDAKVCCLWSKNMLIIKKLYIIIIFYFQHTIERQYQRYCPAVYFYQHIEYVVSPVFVPNQTWSLSTRHCSTTIHNAFPQLLSVMWRHSSRMDGSALFPFALYCNAAWTAVGIYRRDEARIVGVLSMWIQRRIGIRASGLFQGRRSMTGIHAGWTVRVTNRDFQAV